MSRSSIATTTKATAEFNRSSINNSDNDKSMKDDFTRESAFLKPRAPPPRPDSPPMNPMDQ